MPQQYKIGTHKTSIVTQNDGFTYVFYHNTPVVKFEDGLLTPLKLE